MRLRKRRTIARSGGDRARSALLVGAGGKCRGCHADERRRWARALRLDRHDRARSGRRQTFRIVGEDEGEPAKGTIPYVAPLARALSGKEVGDVVRFGEDEIEVLNVD